MPRKKSFLPPPPKAVARGGTNAGDHELWNARHMTSEQIILELLEKNTPRSTLEDIANAKGIDASMTSAVIVGKLIQMRNEEQDIALNPAARGPIANVLAWFGVGRAPSNAGGQQPGLVVPGAMFSETNCETENDLRDSNRRYGSETLFKGTLSGLYVSNKTIDNILGFPHPSSAGLYVFATHDGSGNTKMVGAHVVTLDVSAATMVSNHHRVALGEVNLADVKAVISAYDAALKGGEGKEHRIINVTEFLWRQALFAGTMSGQYVRLTSRADSPGGDSVERVPVLVCAMHMLPYLGLNDILSSSLHMESSSWSSSSTSMSVSEIKIKGLDEYIGKKDEMISEKFEVAGTKISGGSSDGVGKSMQTPGVDLWDAAWHERNSGRSSLSTTACGSSSVASISLHIASQSTATKSSTAMSSSLSQSTASYSPSSTTAGVSSCGVVVTAGSSSQSTAAATSTTVTSTIMNTSSSNAVQCATASILSQGDASSGRVAVTAGAVSADDPRFMWIKDRVVNRTVDMKNESEIAGDATVYPEQQVGT